VTLSPQAQQALASAAQATGVSEAAAASGPAPATAGSATTAPPAWTSDAVAKALAALNDTSGKTSAADRTSAYALLAKTVANPSNFDPSKAANANAVEVATAFATSAFAQHVQSLMAQTGVYGSNEDSQAVQRQLDAFNGLSAADQQTVVAATNLMGELSNGTTPYASVASYVANRQAMINIDRAAEAAFANPVYAQWLTANLPHGEVTYDINTAQFMSLATQASAAGDTATTALVPVAHGVNMNSDAFTAKAQAYFAQFGAPPAATQDQLNQDTAPAQPTVAAVSPTASQVRAMFQSMTLINDSSGASSVAEKLSAYGSLGYGSIATAMSYGPLRVAIGGAASQSSFAAQYDAAQTAFDGTLYPHGTPGSVIDQHQLDNLNGLAADDQQIVFSQQSSGQNTSFASFDSFKSNLQANISVNKIVEGLYAKYNVNYWGKITDSSVTSTQAYKQLVQLLQDPNARTDARTAKAQSVLSLWSQSSSATGSSAAPAAGTSATPLISSASAALALLQNAAKALAPSPGAAQAGKPSWQTGVYQAGAIVRATA
jgi:hypothetical protein